MSLSIDRAIDNVEGIQRSLNLIVHAKQKAMIALVNQFVNNKENTWGHKFLLIFSPAYKEMFNELKEAVSAKDPTKQESSFNRIKEILGLSEEQPSKKEIKKQFTLLQKQAKAALDDQVMIATPDNHVK